MELCGRRRDEDWKVRWEGGVGLKDHAGMLSRDFCESRRRAGCHSCPAGTLLFVPNLGPVLFDPSKAIVSPAWPLGFTGENVVFVLLRVFIPVLRWWGQAGRGSLGGSSPWQLRDKGHPCLLSSALRLAWVAQSSPILSLATNHAVFGVEREFWANSCSFFTFKNCLC